MENKTTMKKCKYLKQENLCALRSFRIEGIHLLAVKTVSGGVPRSIKIDPHFQCKGDLYYYVECEGCAACREYAAEINDGEN